MTRKKIVFYVSEEIDNWLIELSEAQELTKAQLLEDILNDVKDGYDEDEEDSLANYIFHNTAWHKLRED